ncbi:hypothetical protein P4E94_12210 [Pontiellaceae bacterium B12219]|nr:hypothetical protein [Pontiellaceae bacterium B12219]
MLSNDGPDFFAGGFAGIDDIDTLLGATLTSNDTVMISLTVDSVNHTDSSQLRSRGVEFGIAAEPIMSGGSSTSNFIVRVGGGGIGNGMAILLSDNSAGTITSAVYQATEESVNDGFSSIIVADQDGFIIYFDGLLTTSGGPMYPVSGTFTNGHFASAFGTGHYYASVQKRLAGTTTLDISEATLSEDATEAGEFVGSSISDGNFMVQFSGTVGRAYRIESTDNLVFGNWDIVNSFPSLPESPMTVSWPATNNAIFYRVVTP